SWGGYAWVRTGSTGRARIPLARKRLKRGRNPASCHCTEAEDPCSEVEIEDCILACSVALGGFARAGDQPECPDHERPMRGQRTHDVLFVEPGIAEHLFHSDQPGCGLVRHASA